MLEAISNIELPDPITSLTSTSGIACIKFTVSLPAYMDSKSAIDLYEYTSSTPFGSATKVATFRGDSFVFPKLDTTTRYYWVVVKNYATLTSSLECPTSSAGVAGTALPAAKIYESYTATVTGITVSGGGSAVCSVTTTNPGKYELSVSGRMRRTAGTGADSLTPTLATSAGSGSFGGGRQSTWNTSAAGDTTSLSMTSTYTTTGSGPWTFDLNCLHGGGLATFAVDEVMLRVTAVEIP